MILRKRLYRDLNDFYKSSWRNIDTTKVRLTEDLKLELLVLEINQVLK